MINSVVEVLKNQTIVVQETWLNSHSEYYHKLDEHNHLTKVINELTEHKIGDKAKVVK